MQVLTSVILFLLLCVIAPAADAQQTPQKFVRETGYFLYLPEGYENDTTRKWPLIMFLHGSGESGHDLQKVKVHGPPELAEKGKKFPFIIISPQNDIPSGWDIEMLYRLLQQTKKTYRVNENQVFLTGLSMGGYGTWAMAMKYPEEFAAIAPVCGGGDSTYAWRLRNIPAWVFHGAKDDVVLPKNSEMMVNASRRQGANVRYTLYPDANHNSWDSAYNDDSLYSWFLEQRKFNYKEKNLSAASLKKYIGTYLGALGDTIKIAMANDKLALVRKDTVILRAASEDLFFLQPDKSTDIRFNSEKNKVTGFLFQRDRRFFYRRI